MPAEEGSQENIGPAFGAIVSKLHSVLEQFDSKVASGQQDQAIKINSWLIARAFATYGLLKMAFLLAPDSCAKLIMDGINAFEIYLNAISDYLVQNKQDAIKAGENVEILGTNETIFVYSMLKQCAKAGKQA